jgi:hypothetical protein
MPSTRSALALNSALLVFLQRCRLRVCELVCQPVLLLLVLSSPLAPLLDVHGPCNVFSVSHPAPPAPIAYAQPLLLPFRTPFPESPPPSLSLPLLPPPPLNHLSCVPLASSLFFLSRHRSRGAQLKGADAAAKAEATDFFARNDKLFWSRRCACSPCVQVV